jgi:hypothetical protein
MEALSLVKDLFVPINLYWYNVDNMAKPHIPAVLPLGTNTMWDCPWVPHLHNAHLCFGDCIMQCLLLFLDNAYIQIYLNLKFSSS